MTTSPAVLARRLHGLVEPLHTILYFAAEGRAEYEALGLEPRAQGYVAARSAPLGAVGPEVAIATFFNFSPTVIRLGLPGAWEIASPEQVLAARARAVEAAFARIEAPTDGLHEATGLAREAADAADLAGRPLGAGNAGVAPPGTPFADLWQALAVLREHRGDGHVALLTAKGVGPVEALVLHASWHEVPAIRTFLERTRLWDEEDWGAARQRLRDRGWLDADGAPTDAGRQWRDRLETDTDELASAPYAALGQRRCGRLFELLYPLAEALHASGGFPRHLQLPERPG